MQSSVGAVNVFLSFVGIAMPLFPVGVHNVPLRPSSLAPAFITENQHHSEQIILHTHHLTQINFSAVEE
jgi:hypothetical protein